MKNKRSSFPSSIFQDESGKVVITQTPNTPLILAIIFWLVGLVGQPQLDTISLWGVRFWLVYWAGLEVFWGVNLWRKFLGLAVAIWIVAQVFSLT